MSQLPTCPSSNPDVNMVNDVVREIRSSLFLATSIFEDDVPLSSVSPTGSRRNTNTIHFECGRLKYSHVKGEWSILHRPISSCGDDKDEDNKHNLITSKNVIASLWPATKKSEAKLERQKSGRKRDFFCTEDYVAYEVDENDVGSVVNADGDHSIMRAANIPPLPSQSRSGSSLEGVEVSPPLELVRCLLHGAEFVSYLNSARREVETSMHSSMENENYGVNANANVECKKMKNKNSQFSRARNTCTPKARFWSRRLSKNTKQRSINLQPLLNAIIGTNSSLPTNSSLLPMGRSNDDGSKIDSSSLPVGSFLLELVDECIRFAHVHILDLIATWSHSWQVRLNPLSDKFEENTDNDHHFLSTAGVIPTKRRIKRRHDKKGNMPSEAKTSIIDFVRACLAHTHEEVLKSNSSTTGSDPLQSTTEISGESDNNDGDRTLVSTTKRKTAFRRSKDPSLEPSDSLAGRTKLHSTDTNTTAMKCLPSRKNEDPSVEKRRCNRGQSNRHTPQVATPSVLENNKNGFSPESGLRNNTGYRRKKTESLSPKITKNMQMKKEKVAIKDFKNHDDCYLSSNNEIKHDTVADEMNNSILSLYKFFDNPKQQMEDDVSTELFPEAKDSDTSSAPTHHTKQASKYHNGRRNRSPRRSMRWDGVVTSPLVGIEKKIRSNNIPMDNALINQKRKDRAGSVQVSCHYGQVKDRLGEVEDTLSPSSEKIRSNDTIEGSIRSSTEMRIQSSTPVGENDINGKMLLEKVDYLAQGTHHNDQRNQIEDKIDEIDSISNNKVAKFSSKGAAIAVEDTPSLAWVRLSFIGHISDYHGYKRKYEHFAPLQFGPIDDIRKQIGRTLVENMEGNNEESDEEIIQENKDYERATTQYEVFAEKERLLKLKVKDHGHMSLPQESKGGSNENILITFSSRINHTLPLSPTVDAETKKTVGMFEFDESELQPPAKIRYFDEEDGFLFDFDEDNKGEKHKRRSRSARIAAQKKTSIRILNEMLHTLDFIEEYNRKLKCGSGAESENGKEVADAKGMKDMEMERSSDLNEKCEEKPSTRKSRRVACYGPKTCGNICSPITFEPIFVPMTPTTHLENYNALQKRYPSFYTIQAKTDIESVKENIQSMLKKDGLLREFLEGKEFVSEEKQFARCIRGYSSKADQEKIEKKNFEEEQKLKQHEFDYYQQRKKKRSPQDVEWKELVTRPVRYVGRGVSVPERLESCKFKPYCFICDPNLRGECRDAAIYFPEFRRVEEDVYIPFELDSKNESTRRSNSNCLNQHKLASSLILMELYHTLHFIQEYNCGMIVSRKKRR